MISTDDSLRIVPQELWDRVQKRLAEVEKTWPAKKGRQGFQTQTASWVAEYPAELLSGGMVCGVCGAGISKVSGKSGGYYGCFGAVRGKCENRLLVRRTLAERIILGAVRDALASAENIAYVFKRVQQEVEKASAESPEVIRLKAAELDAEDRRIANFVEFVAEGRGSRTLAEALLASERKRDDLKADLELLRKAQNAVQTLPPRIWIEERVSTLQEVLERRTELSARLLRALLGKIRLEPVVREKGRPYYRAVSKLQTLALFELGPPPEGGGTRGSSSLHWRTRSPRIRTAGEVPFEAILFDGSVPVYRQIEVEARRLRVLGFSLARIAAQLGFSKMTITRALPSAASSHHRADRR